MASVPASGLHLGGFVDPATHERTGDPVALSPDDLTTHGVIVGMTGSGKTGLGVGLVEEALLAGIPTLVIDPKGDLSNLLLTFPELGPDDFAPWVEDADPATVAEQWRTGLASWGIDGDRLAALRSGADFTIYTPGSTTGMPLNVVGSLQQPPAGTDLETLADEVEGYVRGLLGLVGIDADPLASREFILLANLIEHAWASGTPIDLPTLVAQVQTPPLRKLGVFDLDAFFPPKDRTALAMRLNGLLASSAFAAWSDGVPLDVDRLLWSDPDRTRPACAIVSLAHLSDEERQFVVSLLLSKLVTWMRSQPGTSKLRTLVYFDEVAGYVPPNGAPAAKKPILTIFKQARAFGVGMVLATQNPVDIDYKAVSNAGTWMIGRLQTEQDKARLLDGMTAAAGGVDIKAVSATISGLAKREFVLRRAGKDRPEVFTTRWAMSYLRGPMTRAQIAEVMAPVKAALVPGGGHAGAEAPGASGGLPAATVPDPASVPGPAAGDGSLAPDETAVAPKVADTVGVTYLDPGAPWLAEVGADPTSTRLEPALVARVQLLFDDDKADLRHTEEWEAVIHPLGRTIAPEAIQAVDYDDRDLVAEPPAGARYVLTGAPLDTASFHTAARKALVDHLYHSRTLTVQTNKALKLYSRPGETPEAFAARCEVAADAAADQAAVALAKKHQARIDRARDALATASDRVAEAEAAQSTRRSEELVSGAGALLGSLLGGKRNARSLGRAVSGMTSRRGRSTQASQRVETARNRVAERQAALESLESDLADALAAIAHDWDDKAAAIEDLEVPLERTDITVAELLVAWLPVPER